MTHLERLCEEEIRDYFNVLLEGNDMEPLCEEDALAASLRGEKVYARTRWPMARCRDKALDIAFKVLDELRNAQKRMRLT